MDDGDFVLGEDGGPDAGSWGPPNERERGKVASMHELLKDDLANCGFKPPPEMVSDWKLLRFLRGYGISRKKACAAYRDMLKHWAEYDYAGIRKVTLEACGGDVSKLVWPYRLAEFKDLMADIWDGIPAAIHHGYDTRGVPTTFTLLSRYNFPTLIEKGYEDKFIRLVQHCDVYFDLILHEKCVATNSLVARRDLTDMTGASLSMGTLRLLRRMGESTKHFPEAILRTDAINFGMVAMKLWQIGSPFLPKQTRRKFVPHRVPGEIPGLPKKLLPKPFYGTCSCLVCQIHFEPVWYEGSISARSSEDLAVQVTLADVKLPITWEIRVDAKDVKFAVAFAKEGGNSDPEILAPEQLWTSEQPARTGTYTAQSPGVLLFKLDNRSSYMTSKTVYYRVTYERPQLCGKIDNLSLKKDSSPKKVSLAKTTML